MLVVVWCGDRAFCVDLRGRAAAKVGSSRLGNRPVSSSFINVDKKGK